MWLFKKTDEYEKKTKQKQTSVPFPFPFCYGTYWFLQVTLGGARAKQQHSTTPVQNVELGEEEKKKGNLDIVTEEKKTDINTIFFKRNV